jgi:hypothetical protein
MQIEQASYVVIQPELTAGETVLWAGQPDPSVRLHREDVFLIPFSLFWGGFSIFWELGVAGYWGSGSNAGKQWFFGMIWGIPFVLLASTSSGADSWWLLGRSDELTMRSPPVV